MKFAAKHIYFCLLLNLNKLEFNVYIATSRSIKITNGTITRNIPVNRISPIVEYNEKIELYWILFNKLNIFIECSLCLLMIDLPAIPAKYNY